MRTDTVDTFLHTLAARTPAPGGGASAALQAAQAAALIEMVARYSDGPRYAEHAAAVGAVREAAERHRELALSLAEEDAAAFAEVGAAYGLPRATGEERAARSRAIGAALVGAGRVPAALVAVCAQLVGLAEELLPVGNRNVVSDIATAADAAGAAASSARVNVEINLGGITDAAARAELTEGIATVDDLTARAEKVTAAVRELILR
ncbi:cyclodeaminase/cyclohydrolase family protein [Streptomyces sp. HNM0574]|uniref:cyclodeaminase/cyclohydrolase family protein n=1 Tax=Streptomyces sp. HNM0574 TaxID=2714954 RepID=UPI00146D9EF5|nr:cyclodeaminase/cyclohydrolase family protein [Streptomyces sp. HNM0574]NLU68375.1 cyclodeaminase/cyclohydrolase family protein [Streptomyces sp. HNM0574]